MRCTFKKNFETAEEEGIGLVIQLKKNQETLYNQVVHGCGRFKPLDWQDDPWEKGHGRLEKRIYEVFDTGEMLKKWPEWKEVKRIIRVKRNRERLAGNSIGEAEVSYYGSNRELSAKEFAKLIREHWWCENKNHYPKDTAFNEDKTTKRVGAFNFSILISLALNILRINKSENIKGDLYLNTMDFNRMMNMVDSLVG
jgi:predicted transposase YbfD/YdcC